MEQQSGLNKLLSGDVTAEELFQSLQNVPVANGSPAASAAPSRASSTATSKKRMTLTRKLKRLTRTKAKVAGPANFQLSSPTNFRQAGHIGFDPEKGEFEVCLWPFSPSGALPPSSASLELSPLPSQPFRGLWRRFVDAAKSVVPPLSLSGAVAVIPTPWSCASCVFGDIIVVPLHAFAFVVAVAAEPHL